MFGGASFCLVSILSICVCSTFVFRNIRRFPLVGDGILYRFCIYYFVDDRLKTCSPFTDSPFAF